MIREELKKTHKEILNHYRQHDLAEQAAFWKRWRENKLKPEEASEFELGRFKVWGVPKEGPRLLRRLQPGE